MKRYSYIWDTLVFDFENSISERCNAVNAEEKFIPKIKFRLICSEYILLYRLKRRLIPIYCFVVNMEFICYSYQNPKEILLYKLCRIGVFPVAHTLFGGFFVAIITKI